MAKSSGFISFGEYKPDLRYFANDGLLRADNVIPVYGGYIVSPSYGAPLGLIAVGPADGTPQGLHIHQANGNVYAPVHDLSASSTQMWQITPAGVVTDVSRAALYALGAFTGCSFGSNVIMTNKTSLVQFQANGTGLFADMITSTFVPRAHFCFSLRNNLFLANCELSAGYDGLPAGANPTLVAWSGSDLFRQFGSFNADPQIIGAGYQQLNFDIGDIRCGLAGADYGIIGHSNGIVRVDGPPYTFRVISRGIGMAFPYGACSVRDDIYFMSPAGLAVLVGGEGPPRIIGGGKFVRSMIDNVTGFGLHAAFISVAATLDYATFSNLSMAHDAVNDIIWVAYTLSGDATPCRGLLAYNIAEDRASFFQVYFSGNPTGTLFLRAGRQGAVGDWMPGRDIRWISSPAGSAAPNQHYLGQPALINGPSPGVSTLQRGYIQLNPKSTSRFLRIRPVYHTTSPYTGQFSVTIESTNRPSAAPTTSAVFTQMDTHGWINTPSTIYADFHSVKIELTPDVDVSKIVELEGFEYEADADGPRYAE